jgi:hypothetical protein
VSHAGVPPTPLPPAGAPGPGCRQGRPHTDGHTDVYHQRNQVGQGTNDVRHGDDQDQGQHGIGRSIRPGTAVPPTVLIADMCDGGLFLEGWRDGPNAYLTASDAMPLRCELAATFGSNALAGCGDPGEAQ